MITQYTKEDLDEKFNEQARHINALINEVVRLKKEVGIVDEPQEEQTGE